MRKWKSATLYDACVWRVDIFLRRQHGVSLPVEMDGWLDELFVAAINLYLLFSLPSSTMPVNVTRYIFFLFFTVFPSILCNDSRSLARGLRHVLYMPTFLVFSYGFSEHLVVVWAEENIHFGHLMWNMEEDCWGRRGRPKLRWRDSVKLER